MEKTNHRKSKTLLAALALFLAAVMLAGCASSAEMDPMATTTPSTTKSTGGQKPPLPEKLSLNDEGIPMLKVYQTDEETVADMNLEDYLEGVLAGEMKNDWPMEALKAQAILARTFVLKFCTDKESKYQGADISTDIEEAQAYDATGINDRIVKAVEETKGEVLSYQGELPYAWFHAHSGGMTTRAKTGLDYELDEPGYTQTVEGRDSDKAPADAKSWSASFSADEFLKAAKEVGLKSAEQLKSLEMGEKDESGRATTLVINGEKVSAAAFRIAIGSQKMRSTLLSEISLTDGTVKMSGKGYGHGVGMPQWGAYGMAEEGKQAEEIVQYYFRDVTVEKVW